MISNATQIREYLKELLDDGKKHSRSELFEYVRSRSGGKNYTEGMITGSLRTLVDSGSEYACVERAIYQKVGKKSNVGNTCNYDNTVIEEYRKILEKTVDCIKNEVKITPFQFLELSADDKSKILEVQKCVAIIEEVLQKL